MDARMVVQAITLALTIAASIMLAAMVALRVIGWRISVMPGIILAEWIALYTYVLFVRPDGNQAMYSAIIRLQEITVVLVFLAMYWWRRRWTKY